MQPKPATWFLTKAGTYMMVIRHAADGLRLIRARPDSDTSAEAQLLPHAEKRALSIEKFQALVGNGLPFLGAWNAEEIHYDDVPCDVVAKVAKLEEELGDAINWSDAEFMAWALENMLEEIDEDDDFDSMHDSDLIHQLSDLVPDAEGKLVELDLNTSQATKSFWFKTSNGTWVKVYERKPRLIRYIIHDPWDGKGGTTDFGEVDMDKWRLWAATARFVYVARDIARDGSPPDVIPPKIAAAILSREQEEDRNNSRRCDVLANPQIQSKTEQLLLLQLKEKVDHLLAGGEATLEEIDQLMPALMSYDRKKTEHNAQVLADFPSMRRIISSSLMPKPHRMSCKTSSAIEQKLAAARNGWVGQPIPNFTDAELVMKAKETGAIEIDRLCGVESTKQVPYQPKRSKLIRIKIHTTPRVRTRLQKAWLF